MVSPPPAGAGPNVSGGHRNTTKVPDGVCNDIFDGITGVFGIISDKKIDHNDNDVNGKNHENGDNGEKDE